jgi:MFS transporter, DHA2 family, glioxin efflux transporter
MRKVVQTLGGAFGLSAAQSGFINKMISTLASTAPDVNPAMVIATGATQIRTAFPADQIPGIVDAYMAGVKVPFAIATATVSFSFLVALCGGWKKLHPEALKQATGGG